MKAFTSIPFFRILIPFVVGILIGLKLQVPSIPLYFLFLLLIPIMFFWKNLNGTRSGKWLFMVFADVFLIFFGLILVEKNDLSKQAAYYGNMVNTDSVITFIATLSDVPTEKERSVKCRLRISKIRSNGNYVETEGTILAYFRKSSLASSLRQGTTLLIKTRLQPISSPKNPEEFHYQNYLYNKQIYHTAFIDSNTCIRVNITGQLNPVWSLGLTCKEFVLNRLKNGGLNKSAYGICAALITGYDQEIDKSVIDAFSHSGTLHVLSVSGLHTGIIYLMLGFLFDFFDKKNRYKLTRLLFITVFLWFFALLTGFSAPVLRAVIMFNLLGAGRIYFRANYKHQVNILLVSAFILLLYNPNFILEVGFLLSYFALFGLLYFQPGFSRIWQPKSRTANYVWQSVTASMAATIGTLPITLFYFKQFPLWFFVCNIVVVPATFLVLILSVLVVFKLNLFALLTNYIVSGLIGFINFFNSENTGYIDAIHFNFKDTFFLTIFIILLSVAVQYRSYKQLIFSFLLLITWQLFCLFDSYNSKVKSLFVVYNIRNKSIVAVKNKTQVHLTGADSTDYNFSVKPQVTSFNYPQISYVNFNALKTKNELVLFLNQCDVWPRADYGKVTTLVLQNNFKFLKQDLLEFKNLKTIVMDASNNKYSVAKTEELSRNFGVAFYTTAQKGAYLKEL